MLHVIERIFSFSHAAAGNTVMSYGRWITAGNIAVAEFAFRTHLYLHMVVWRLPSLEWDWPNQLASHRQGAIHYQGKAWNQIIDQ